LNLKCDFLVSKVCFSNATTCTATTRGGGVKALWATLFCLYLSMFNVGQTFLSFQWDILLLEVGFLCVFLPPTFRPSSRDPPNPLSLWLLRFLMFKLMLMSGVGLHNFANPVHP
jgi:hypothetical protein